MKTKTGAAKVNISMPKELYDYLKKMVDEHNAKPENQYCPTDFSKMVQKAIREMMNQDARRSTPMLGQAMPDLNEKPLKHTPVAGPEILIPHKQFAGGSSTAPTTRYRKAGKAK